MSINFTKLSNITLQSKDEDEEDEENSDCSSDSNNAWSSSSPIHGQRFAPRSRQTSPGPSSFGSIPTRFGSNKHSSSSSSFRMMMRKKVGKVWYKRPLTVGLILLVGFFFWVNWWMLSRIQDSGRAGHNLKLRFLKANSTTVSIPVSF